MDKPARDFADHRIETARNNADAAMA